MNIGDIFAVVEGSLLAVKYDEHKVHEFARLFDLWNDPEYLHTFFTEHEEDLCSGFFGNISIEDAVLRTRKDAKVLENKLYNLAEKGHEDGDYSLATLFKPLTERTAKLSNLESSKAKGLQFKSWLRIYAIRPFADDPNFYIVTGGAIKLTEKMQGRRHTELELVKIEATLAYLENPDNHSLFELY